MERRPATRGLQVGWGVRLSWCGCSPLLRSLELCCFLLRLLSREVVPTAGEDGVLATQELDWKSEMLEDDGAAHLGEVEE
jgi:hypothetical protein